MFQLPNQLSLKFTTSKGPFKKILSPNDGKLITEVQFADEKDINLILETTLLAQKEMAKLHPFERAEILKKVAADKRNVIKYF